MEKLTENMIRWAESKFGSTEYAGWVALERVLNLDVSGFALMREYMEVDTQFWKYCLAAPNTELPVSTILLSRGGIAKTYPDVTIKSIKISAAAQDYVKVDIDIAGVNELNAGDTGAQTVQSLTLTLPSYRCTQATLKYAAGGTAKASVTQNICVKECNITIDNGTEDAPATYCSGLYAGRPVPGLRVVSVDFSIPYSDAVDTLRNTYYKDPTSPTVALLLKFTTSDADESVEMAEVIMQDRRRFEVQIRRITAVARFCGIHLVMTTNIISADTITSTIKSNIPTTIALAVSNQIQSRIALDRDGAEKLLREGDILYYRTDLQQSIRIQGVLCGPDNGQSIKRNRGPQIQNQQKN